MLRVSAPLLARPPSPLHLIAGGSVVVLLATSSVIASVRAPSLTTTRAAARAATTGIAAVELTPRVDGRRGEVALSLARTARLDMLVSREINPGHFQLIGLTQLGRFDPGMVRTGYRLDARPVRTWPGAPFDVSKPITVRVPSEDATYRVLIRAREP